MLTTMSKIAIISALVISTVGCAWFRPAPYEPPPPVEVRTVEVRPPIFQPPLPQELLLEDVKFYVITEGNLEEQMEEISQLTGGEFVVFAVTPRGYENLAYNMQEIRRYIRQVKEIVLYYREVTKNDQGSTAQEWLEHNEQLRQEFLNNND